ncbi:hypothetical protein BTR14_20595 [Rhizobium rhizosphaerae]|uniref:Uncharacterized protein n=1 Tax=Xaviernesmea rhizosphaerae TaxID=1672749 RepID=A0ABX3P9C6_9HYPH|nr:hypothetical protein [Xaviernesmea rhizosphaerae]OQP84203.1 hypothetical protein BTR14_20595 [Xaviernesmea rhizosphaerae]
MNVHVDITEASNAPARIEGEKRRQEANSAVATAPDTEAAPVALTGLDLAWAEFRTATARWMLTVERNGDLDENGPAYDAAQAACDAVVTYQCQTDADVQRKIEIVLKEPLIRETAQMGHGDDDGDVFDAFLKSLQIRTNDISETTSGHPGQLETPIMATARRLSRARADMELFESQKYKANRKDDHRAASIFERAERDRYDEELTLREALSLEQAASVSDAAIQAAELVNTFELLMDQVPEGEDTFQFRRDTRAARRLMYSIFHFLDRASPEPVSAIVDADFGAPRHSPWVHPSRVIGLYEADDEEATAMEDAE